MSTDLHVFKIVEDKGATWWFAHRTGPEAFVAAREDYDVGIDDEASWAQVPDDEDLVVTFEDETPEELTQRAARRHLPPEGGAVWDEESPDIRTAWKATAGQWAAAAQAGDVIACTEW